MVRRPELLEDPRFRTSPDRRKNRKVLEEMVEKMFLQQGHEEWTRRLQEAKLPHGRLNGIAEVLAHPQVIARKMIREMKSPVGPVPVIGSPLRLSDSAVRFDPIPALGQDTEPILRELGYADAEIATLRRDKVI